MLKSTDSINGFTRLVAEVEFSLQICNESDANEALNYTLEQLQEIDSADLKTYLKVWE